MYVDSDTGKNEEAEGENEAAGGGVGHRKSSSGAVGRKGRKDVVGGEEEDHRLRKWSDLLSVYLVAGLSGLWYQWVCVSCCLVFVGFILTKVAAPHVWFILFRFFFFFLILQLRLGVCYANARLLEY